MRVCGVLRSAVAALALSAAFAAPAQTYPAKPVRIIVPFPPGGTTDQIARIVQPRFSEFLGQPVVIDNKGGAGGSIGAAEAARAAPDGYTLLMVFDTHAVNQHLYKQAPDVFKVLEHISLMTTSPVMLVGSLGFAPRTLQEVVAAAKADAGESDLRLGRRGQLEPPRRIAARAARRREDDPHPYKGGGPLLQAILGGQVDIVFGSAPLILPHVKGGKVKAIAVGSRQRLAALPEVPTLSETYPGMEMMSWFGILAPVGLPRDVFARVHRDMVRTLNAPDVRQKLTDAGFDVVGSSPEEFLKFVQGESDKLGKLIRDSGIKVD